MKSLQITLLFCLMTAISISVQAKEVAGVQLPDVISVGEQTLILNGAGARKKFIFKLYVAGLYVLDKSDNADNLINSDTTTSIKLQITSKLVSAKKMEKAIQEGFEKSTANNTASIQQEIDDFLLIMREELKKGDRYDMTYIPNEGTYVKKNGEEKTLIKGLEFKKALFGIWLSDDPVQKSLKTDLLGQ